jgi:hypothetical protein
VVAALLAAGADMNLLNNNGAFGKRLVNIQGTFGEHSGNGGITMVRLVNVW